eukprot:CAMPEP_0204140706 /NCGR_PEP_ID=MMETSP0361-20130328/19113_1 /ASSEMBLY_ACC=CAM_ASM_000343 /TAXON_ID=268821 /ORGANISM="Scrippsiella Hangoei, Strain SHTV-5" /LENGTH=134 /DNA_ID=CAMNT_0051094521 /DNA_START=982 /DNA_END=1386 /DNA_ORIENTATION=-
MLPLAPIAPFARAGVTEVEALTANCIALASFALTLGQDVHFQRQVLQGLSRKASPMSSQVSIDDDAEGRIVCAIAGGADLQMIPQEVGRSRPHNANAHRVAETSKQPRMTCKLRFPLYPALSPASLCDLELRME